MQQNIISNFFRPINTDIQIPDSEYAKTDVCIVMADALARNTNHSLYIIDYHRKNFLYCFNLKPSAIDNQQIGKSSLFL